MIGTKYLTNHLISNIKISEIVQSNYDGNETQISTTIKEWLKNASTRTKYVTKH
jgi:hypothetical protein